MSVGVELSRLGHPDINPGGHIKHCWHDSNYSKGFPIQVHGHADNSRVPAELLLPETLANEHNLLPTRAVFFRKETTAEQRHHFRNLKKRCGDRSTTDLLKFPLSWSSNESI